LFLFFLGRPIALLMVGGLIGTWSAKGQFCGPFVGKII
jgi:hypothetical protein